LLQDDELLLYTYIKLERIKVQADLNALNIWKMCERARISMMGT